jgi:molybdopterin molybdotransferase
MITFQEAYKITMDHINTIMETENVSLCDASGRILAEDIKADRDVPAFNRVAMDGYACRRQDIQNELLILETITAGKNPEKLIEENQCSKVMTGCPLPVGADMVFMKEYSEELAENRVKCTGTERQIENNNFAPKGEDISTGDVVLTKGTFISPKHIGVMASVGCSEPHVVCQPIVGIIATGNEIVEPSNIPKNYQIRNSNSYQLITQVKQSGSIPKYYGIAEDTFESIYSILRRAENECDVILLSGGVSMGDFDLVPDVLKNNNYNILYDKVAVKPGKPTTFAVSPGTVCFGLPGNPVSTFVIFELLVKPFLYGLMGYKYLQSYLKLPLEKTISRKKVTRETYLPVKINNRGEIFPLDYHGSGHFHALSFADGLIKFSQGEKELKKGMIVNVRQI